MPTAPAQSPEPGPPVLRTWQPIDEKAVVQFHRPFQTKNGLMYFGNRMAFVENDGRNWRPLQVPFSLGLFIGCLEAPTTGNNETISHDFGDHGPEALRRFGRVRDIQYRDAVVGCSSDDFTAAVSRTGPWRDVEGAILLPADDGHPLAVLANRRVPQVNLNDGSFAASANDAGKVGVTSSYPFQAGPAWLRPPFTHALYLIITIGAVAAFVRHRLSAGKRERVRLEQLVQVRTAELAIARDAAEAANRAKSAFLANMSHELRTPLNGVLGYAQILLRDQKLADSNREQARVIASSGEHLLKMINEVLDFSRIEAGQTELHAAPFRLPDLLRDIEAAFTPRAAARQLTFRVTHDTGLPVQCIGDAKKLRQVIDNLLSNAIKSTTQGGVTLEVTRAVSGDHLRLGFAVIDTGRGQPDQDQSERFTPFPQAINGRPAEPGIGLGLSICQRLVQLMGGEIKVTSAVGHGNRFAFSIPLEEIALIEDTNTPDDDAVIIGYSGDRRNVLVVDDVEMNRNLLRDLLQAMGFAVTCLPDGMTALAWLTDHQPDVIVLDLRMPGIDGLELTRQIRARGEPQPRVILTSASVLSFDPQVAFDAGCDDFLPKPFRKQDLLQRMGRTLRLVWSYAAIDAAGEMATVSGVPSPLLNELKSAAVRGDIRRVRSALTEIRRSRALPSGILTELDGFAAAYQMDRLRRRLHELLPTAGDV